MQHEQPAEPKSISFAILLFGIAMGIRAASILSAATQWWEFCSAGIAAAFAGTLIVVGGRTVLKLGCADAPPASRPDQNLG
ncbi:hypothetical protein ACFUTX_13640 [Microbacterium sp. NPDC057407]|uniref:hypothetical protein n=1 Tax=Microbacterium sp. NPDC057407 TaxID=3346120 RepID=UPI0036715DF6